jgi:Na+/glutamate symporter
MSFYKLCYVHEVCLTYNVLLALGNRLRSVLRVGVVYLIPYAVTGTLLEGGVIQQLCNKWYYWTTWFNWELNKMKKARTTNLVLVFFKTNVEIVASRTDFRCDYACH